MLQRIQSVWYFLAAIAVFLTLKFPTYSGTNKELIPSTFLNGTSSLIMIFVTLAVGIICLITIFLYKNRPLQLKISLLALLLQVVLIYLYYNAISSFVQGTLSLTSVLHALVIVFIILGIQGVRRDEKIIKDSNRLR
ncbi:DUF4293 family protein [Ferruginibacter yonginensis]|uniref:DUF4293 family protein n=1 Tax=Ferruginibacter yonginensis TaxID=1310416 RepID=A0ABV8QUB7_9BACT